jgi:hypothetical protein
MILELRKDTSASHRAGTIEDSGYSDLFSISGDGVEDVRRSLYG